MMLQEEFQGLDDIVDVVKLVVLHAVPQKHVGRAFNEAQVQQF